MHPYDATVLSEAACCEERGDLAGALECLYRLVALMPNSPGLYHRRAWLRAKLGDVQGAIADWSSALEIDPTFADAYADRAVARLETGDLAGAAYDWRRAWDVRNDRGRLGSYSVSAASSPSWAYCL